MPVRNEEEHVGEQLAALGGQGYSGDWEVVVVDSSTDRTLEIVHAWAGRFPDLRVLDASEKPGLNHARNRGAAAARGDFLVFCDGDDVVAPGWLEGLVAAAPEADLVGGRQDLELLNDEVMLTWCPWRSSKCLVFAYGFLPYAPGANMGIWTEVAREIGWDEDFRFGASDAEFSWRVTLSGRRVGTAPEALLHRRLRPQIREVARQAYGYGTGGALLYRKFRGVGMPRGVDDARHWWWWLIRRWRAPLQNRGQRGLWLRIASLRIGRLVGSLRARVFFP
jgi:glycosyltransferase involved in cell wall biosynthesis